MQIEVGKTYQTKSGYTVRILCMDAPGHQPIIGITTGGSLMRWGLNGQFHPAGPSADDLRPVPREWTVWLCPDGTLTAVESVPSTPIRVQEVLND